MSKSERLCIQESVAKHIPSFEAHQADNQVFGLK